MNEFGVICLLSDDSLQALRKIPYLDKVNKPHLSLFQFQSDDVLLHDKFKTCIRNLLFSSHYLTAGISQYENNIFLDIQDDSTLKIASDTIADLYLHTCKDKKPLSQIDIHHLSKEKKKLVDQYGIYWIKDGFVPHITLAYETSSLNNLKIPYPNNIKLQNPTICKIDRVGRVI